MTQVLSLRVAVALALAPAACSSRERQPPNVLDAVASSPDAGATPDDLSRDAERRRDALRQFVRSDTAGSRGALVAALDDPSGLVRAVAVKLAQETNHPDTMQIMKRMKKDPRPVVRLAVAETLRRLDNPAAMSELLGWAPDDHEGFIRYSVARTFADRKDRRIVPFLERELRRPDSPDFPRGEIELMLRELGAE